MARCPAHDDHEPSLSITEAKDGKVLVHCHAGCDQRDVIDALISLAYGRIMASTGSGDRRRSDQSRRNPRNRTTPRECGKSGMRPPIRAKRWSNYLESRGLILPEDIAGRVIRYHPRCPFRTRTAPALPGRAVLANTRRPRSRRAAEAIHRIRLDRFTAMTVSCLSVRRRPGIKV